MRKIAKNIVLFFIIFIIITAAFLVTLSRGISADRLWLGPVLVEGLYIKIENRLVVRIKSVSVKPSANSVATSDYKELLWLTNHLNWMRAFEEILVENLEVAGYDGRFIYKDKEFFVDTAQLAIRVAIKARDGELAAKVDELRLKGLDFVLRGDLRADLRRERYEFVGDFRAHELKGAARLRLEKSLLNYEIGAVQANSIKDFTDSLAAQTGMNETLKKWIYGNIIAQNYEINRASGKIDIKSGEIFADDIRVDAVLRGVDIRFHPDLEPVKADEIGVQMAQNQLIFSLKSPKYASKELDGSKVVISDIIGDKSALNLHIKTSAPFDEAMAQIPKAYGANIAICQLSGSLDSEFDLRLRFKDLELQTEGRFILNNAQITIGGAPFGSKIADIKLQKDGKIAISNANLYNEIFEADFGGELEPGTGGSLDAVFRRISVGDLVDINGLKSAVLLDLSGDADSKIRLNELGVLVQTGADTLINIDDIKPIIKYSKLAQTLNIKAGSVQIKDADKLSAKASVRFDLGLLDERGAGYEGDDFTILKSKNLTSIRSKSGKIAAQIRDKNIALSLQNLRFKSGDADDKSSFDAGEYKIHISGSDVGAILGSKEVVLSSVNGDIAGSKMQLNGTLSKGKMQFLLAPNHLKITADGLSSDVLNSFMGSKSFEGGEFSVRLEGADFKNFVGEVGAKKTHLGEFKGYSQFLAFLDAIPSLISFKTPDFSDKGLTVNSGILRMQRKDDALYIKGFELIGNSVDIIGSGVVGIDSGALDMSLELRVLKRASSVIGSIPVVGSILLGENGTISTLVRVSGTTDEPKYETQIAEDILKTPYNLIKNTLSLPFKWLQ